MSNGNGTSALPGAGRVEQLLADHAAADDLRFEGIETMLESNTVMLHQVSNEITGLKAAFGVLSGEMRSAVEYVRGDIQAALSHNAGQDVRLNSTRAKLDTLNDAVVGMSMKKKVGIGLASATGLAALVNLLLDLLAKL